MSLRDLPKAATGVQVVAAIEEWLRAKLQADEDVLPRSSLARTRYATLTELRDDIAAWKGRPS